MTDAINISIAGVCGIDRAVLIADPIALVVGQNGAGKTSIAQATAAALTGDPLIRGVGARNRLNSVVRGGFENGTAAVGWEAGTATIRWPDGESKGQGTPPQASPIAAGTERPTAMSEAQRSVFFTELLDAAPSRDDLAKALKAENFGDAAIDKLWSGIKADGWDAMHKKAREGGVKLKGAWEQVTGERFGSAKAGSWLPPGWTDDLEGKSVDGLQAELAKARDDLEANIGKSAVSGEKLAEMKKWAGHLERFEKDLADFRAERDEAAAKLEEAREARKALPDSEGPKGTPCPHGCEGKLICTELRQNVVFVYAGDEPEKITDAERKKRRGAIAHADGEISRLEAEVTRLDKAVFDTEGGIDRSKQAQADLEAAGATDDKANDVDAAREDVRSAEARLKAFEAKVEASSLYGRYRRNQTVIDLLAPTGLRKSCLASALDTFNADDLAPLAKAFGLPAVAVDEELSVRMGNRSYGLLSAGEQFAVDAVLQVAAAKRDGSDMVVVDGAEVLVGPRRSGLLKMLIAAGIPAVVCVALKGAALAPDLAASGHGNSYWIEGAAAIPFGDLEQEDAA